MAKFKISINIEASDAEQANNCARGLADLAKKVNGAELSKMLNLLAKNPAWITMAKNATKTL